MKKLILFLLLYSNLIAGQQTTFNVQSDFGYPFIFLRSVLPTDSCYYVTGFISDTTGGTNKLGNLFIKFDLNGDTLLTKKLVSNDKEYSSWLGDIIPTEDGGLLRIGQVYDSLERGLIVKFNTEGDTLQTKEYLSPFSDNEIFLPYVVVKMQNSNMAVLNAVEMSDLNNQMLLTFHDEQYSVELQKEYGGPMDEVPGSMILDDDGGLIIGANLANTNTNIQNYVSLTYIFKVDSVGNLAWYYLSPIGQLQDKARSMVKTPDGGLVVASGKGIEHPINVDVGQLRWHGYIFKLNASHQFVWGREIRGIRHSGAAALIKVLAAPDGSGYVAYGRVLEDHSVGTEQLGSWMVKVSNQGDSLWARYYTFFDGHDRSPDPADFKATPDGGYIVVGNTGEGTLDFGWVMKLDSFGCLIPGCNANDGPNAATEEKAEIKLAIYPNPTTDFLNFELRTQQQLQKASFRIYDSSGRLVKEFASASPKDTFIVPVWDWEAGVYFLQFIMDGEVRALEQFVVVKR